MTKNRIIRIRPIRLKYRFTSEECFAFLLGLIWTDHILLSYVRAVLLRIPYLSDYREHIISLLFLVALILSLPYMVKRIHPGVLVAYLLISVVYFLNLLLFPQNKEALHENLVPFLFKSLPLVFIGEGVNLKKHYRMLYSLSMLTVIARFIHILLEPYNNIYGDMYASYKLLPHVCMMIAAALSEKNLRNMVVSFMGILSIISLGTRGSILCMFFLVVFYMLLFEKIQKHMWFFSFMVVSIFLIVFFYEEIIFLLLRLIQNMGMSTRVIDLLLSGDIASTTGRDRIQAQLMEAVSNNWFGYGIAGDRAIVGTYAHNILVEFWVSYGVFVGTALFVIPVFRTVLLLLRKTRDNAVEDVLILALISSSFVKLFMSGTYLTEAFLYLLIGIVISESKAMKNRNKIDSRHG